MEVLGSDLMLQLLQGSLLGPEQRLEHASWTEPDPEADLLLEPELEAEAVLELSRPSHSVCWLLVLSRSPS